MGCVKVSRGALIYQQHNLDVTTHPLYIWLNRVENYLTIWDIFTSYSCGENASTFLRSTVAEYYQSTWRAGGSSDYFDGQFWLPQLILIILTSSAYLLPILRTFQWNFCKHSSQILYPFSPEWKEPTGFYLADDPTNLNPRGNPPLSISLFDDNFQLFNSPRIPSMTTSVYAAFANKSWNGRLKIK